MPTLQRLCERSLAQHAVEPRTCLQIMEYADACGAEVLKQFCLGVRLLPLHACQLGLCMPVSLPFSCLLACPSHVLLSLSAGIAEAYRSAVPVQHVSRCSVLSLAYRCSTIYTVQLLRLTTGYPCSFGHHHQSAYCASTHVRIAAKQSSQACFVVVLTIWQHHI